MITSNTELLKLVPAEYVPVSSGGTSTDVFDPTIYDNLQLIPGILDAPGAHKEAVEVS